MLVLKIIGLLFALWASMKLIHVFDTHCHDKFNYRFFTFISLLLVTASVWLITLGSSWYSGSSKVGGDQLNGIVLILIGAGFAAYQIKKNYDKSNTMYCIIGSLLQIPFFGVLSYWVISNLIEAALASSWVTGLLAKLARL